MPERKPLTPYAKGAAYMGLALVTPISGWVCYMIGKYLDARIGANWIGVAGLLVGCAAGMYETYRQALSIEGMSSLVPKPPKDNGPKQE